MAKEKKIPMEEKQGTTSYGNVLLTKETKEPLFVLVFDLPDLH